MLNRLLFNIIRVRRKPTIAVVVVVVVLDSVSIEALLATEHYCDIEKPLHASWYSTGWSSIAALGATHVVKSSTGQFLWFLTTFRHLRHDHNI